MGTLRNIQSHRPILRRQKKRKKKSEFKPLKFPASIILQSKRRMEPWIRSCSEAESLHYCNSRFGFQNIITSNFTSQQLQYLGNLAQNENLWVLIFMPFVLQFGS